MFILVSSLSSFSSFCDAREEMRSNACGETEIDVVKLVDVTHDGDDKGAGDDAEFLRACIGDLPVPPPPTPITTPSIDTLLANIECKGRPPLAVTVDATHRAAPRM